MPQKKASVRLPQRDLRRAPCPSLQDYYTIRYNPCQHNILYFYGQYITHIVYFFAQNKTTGTRRLSCFVTKYFQSTSPCGEDSNIITRSKVLVKDYFGHSCCRFFPTTGVGFFRHLIPPFFSPRVHTREIPSARNISPPLRPPPAAYPLTPC